MHRWTKPRDFAFHDGSLFFLKKIESLHEEVVQRAVLVVQRRDEISGIELLKCLVDQFISN